MGALSEEHIKSSVWGREELKMSKREHKEMHGGRRGGVRGGCPADDPEL